MADPRTFVVKQCQPAYAAGSGADIASATSSRVNFFNSIGKVGDLQVLNDIGGSKIGRGLRTLASISNSIRGGCGSIPSTIGSTIDAGARWVVESVGMSQSVVDAVRTFQPAIANQAYGQAKQIFSKVKQGHFKFTDIPDYMQDFQNLERLGKRIFTPDSGDVQSTAAEHCDASPYAIDLIARAPKYKFLFVIQFVPSAAYASLASDLGPLDMAFVVKRSTRPSPKFHEEDVNYYNYRSKVITKVEFSEMQMSFHDDNLNTTMQFYDAYMRAMSPIANIDERSMSSMEQSGMDFGDNVLKEKQIRNAIAANAYAATHGLLAGNEKSVFKEIRMYHIYDWGHHMNVWRFLNPQITQMTLDEVDMSIGSEGCNLDVSFVYDSVYLDAGVEVANNGGKYKLSETQRGAVYPLRFRGAGDSGVPNNSGINPYGTTTPQPGVCDPMNPVSTSGINNIGGLISGGGIGGAISKATSSLATLRSNALNALPFG